MILLRFVKRYINTYYVIILHSTINIKIEKLIKCFSIKLKFMTTNRSCVTFIIMVFKLKVL